jgi:hypothetical protein
LHTKIAKNKESTPKSLTYSELVYVYSTNKFCFSVLRPLNIEVKLKIALTPHQQDFAHPVLDAKIDLGQINMNINRNQVRKKSPFRFSSSAILVFEST